MKKIAIIGGGSRNWAITFMRDLALDEDYEGTLALYDIDTKAAKENEDVARRIFSLTRKTQNINCIAENDIDKALQGADLVVISIEPGDTELRYGDIVIPQQYGILQTVGDTTGPGGLVRAARALPLFFGFALKIRQNCPKAWVINYTNPLTLCTAALYKAYPEIKAFGCCHEVFGTQNYIAGLVSKWFEVELPKREEIHLDITGVNHFTFATKATWKNQDLTQRLRDYSCDPFFLSNRTEAALLRKSQKKWFECDRLVAMEFLRSFGNLGAAGDRHLSEFVPFILTSEANIARYGITQTPYQWRLEESIRKRNMKFTDEDLCKGHSDEEGVAIMEALLGSRTVMTNLNYPNQGQVPFLEKGAIVETNAFISQDSIRCLTTDLPSKAVVQMLQRVSSQQTLALEAIWQKDESKLFEALLMDSLMHISITKAKEMFKAMLEVARIKL